MRFTLRLVAPVLIGLALVAAACGNPVVTSRAPSPPAGAPGPSATAAPSTAAPSTSTTAPATPPATAAPATTRPANAAPPTTALTTSTVDTAGTTSTGGVRTYRIPPTAPDPATTGPSAPNVVMVGPESTWNGLLVVFLPGSGAQPKCCLDFLALAASLGFHVIGLTYDNSAAVARRCRDDLACYGEERRNIFNGGTPTAHLTTPPHDTIQHRLVALLSYLNALYPDEGWAPYLPSSSSVPDYSRIVMTGHSQGGGEAAFIGTVRMVKGVVALSSPPDTNSKLVAATWLAAVRQGQATPANRFYAFVHTGDPFGSRILADWTAMGLAGLSSPPGPISVDTSGPPYGGAHELVSSAPLPSVALATHDSTAVDAAQPALSERSARVPDGVALPAPGGRRPAGDQLGSGVPGRL